MDELARGMAVAVTPYNLLYCLIGVTLGTLVGVLPGLGPSAVLAMLLPVTFGLDPTSAMIMLAGVYYGAKYGGAITSILVNVPGEASSVMTALDGHKLAVRGFSGAALGLAAVSSFVGGMLSYIALMLFAPPLAEFALGFGPPEYFMLVLLGLSAVVVLGSGSTIKALLAALLGALLGTVGLDPMSGAERFTLGRAELLDGVDFVIVAMGLFGVAEILGSVNQREPSRLVSAQMGSLWSSWRWIKECRWTFVRSSVIGFLVGVLPGTGAAIASFLAYSAERSISRRPERFGTGVPQGVAASETADNASTGGSFVPLLALGIPGSGATAVLLGAMVMYGLRPGPLLFVENPTFVWGLIASFLVGNLMLLVLNFPMVPLFASALRVPYGILYPSVMAFMSVGAYALRGSVFDVWLLLFFGVLGHLFRKLELPPAPLVLALVLVPIAERTLVQSLAMSHGALGIFVGRPASLILVVATAMAYLLAIVRVLRRARHGAMALDQASL